MTRKIVKKVLTRKVVIAIMSSRMTNKVVKKTILVVKKVEKHSFILNEI